MSLRQKGQVLLAILESIVQKGGENGKKEIVHLIPLPDFRLPRHGDGVDICFSLFLIR